MAEASSSSPSGSNSITQDKANQAKMLIENFYTNLVNQYKEREQRWKDYLWFERIWLFIVNRGRRLEEKMKEEGLSEAQVELIDERFSSRSLILISETGKKKKAFYILQNYYKSKTMVKKN